MSVSVYSEDAHGDGLDRSLRREQVQKATRLRCNIFSEISDLTQTSLRPEQTSDGVPGKSKASEEPMITDRAGMLTTLTDGPREKDGA